MADRVGQQLGNYRLLTLLGKGGFAEVYLGQHLRFNQQAAIKLLHMHLIGTEAEHFRYEAETIALLAHPGIVRVFDFDVQEGAPFLVLEYAPNGSLRRRHPKGEVVPLPTLVSYVKQVAGALQYAHEHKIIHRDVKPENMLVGRQQEVLLSDFGLATLAQSTSSLNMSAQPTAGTIAYMAPEQIAGHPRVASDQYALGVVVYEWLCGQRPFEGSMSEVMVQQLSLPPHHCESAFPRSPLRWSRSSCKPWRKTPKSALPVCWPLPWPWKGPPVKSPQDAPFLHVPRHPRPKTGTPANSTCPSIPPHSSGASRKWQLSNNSSATRTCAWSPSLAPAARAKLA
jgi:eukaryotic-like serine/threonine-protein kinase